MKIIILTVILSFVCSSVYAQKIYFGYPLSLSDLSNKDRVLINIPTHIDGRFIPEGGVNKLVELLNKDSTLFFRIEIHYFFGSDEFAEDYSKFICTSLEWYLKQSTHYSNYDLFGLGKSHPVFLDKAGPNYNKMNTRIEILVE